jgi:3-hydroxyacyl-CoA dehydrogenase
MGMGIAQVVAASGMDVIVRDIEEQLVKNGQTALKKSLKWSVNKEKLSEEESAAIQARVAITVDLNEAVADADLVIEAVVEDMAVKKKVFKELDTACQKTLSFPQIPPDFPLPR